MVKLKYPNFTKKSKIILIILSAVVIIGGFLIYCEVLDSRYLAASRKIAIKMAEDRAKVECKKEGLSDDVCGSLSGYTIGDFNEKYLYWSVYVKSRDSISYRTFVTVHISSRDEYSVES